MLRLAVFCSTAVVTQAATILSESFESLVLQPFQSASTLGDGDGTDWTSSLPPGWAMTFSGPVGDPVEFRGWRVIDVDSWIATQFNQDRNTWTAGGVGSRGQVLVADPDAYDDETNVDTALYNTSITTPPIDLSLLFPNSVSIAFDSFWRTEPTQIGTLDVSFDGGVTYTTLLEYDGNVMVDEFIDARPVFNLNNPDSGTLLFRFSLNEASNDWWWAIDDVEISAERKPTTPVPDGAVSLAAPFALLCGLQFLRNRRVDRSSGI